MFKKRLWISVALCFACGDDEMTTDTPSDARAQDGSAEDGSTLADGSLPDGGRNDGQLPAGDSCQLMVPFGTSAPSESVFPRVEHPRKPIRLSDSSAPLPTNHFMTNVILEPGNEALYVHPYVLKLSTAPRGGMEVSHADEPVLGELTGHDTSRFYFSAFAHDIGLTMLEGASDLAVTGYDEVSVELAFSGSGSASMVLPVVRGMAYVTAEYTDATPVITTIHAVTEINDALPSNEQTFSPGVLDVRLNSGERWRIYASDESLQWTWVDGELRADAATTAVVRIAKVPEQSNAFVALLDAHVGTYPTGASLSAAMNSARVDAASYSFTWKTKGGDAGELLHYAFDHHQQTISLANVEETALSINSTTKGAMKAYIGERWTLREPSLTKLSWMPPRKPDEQKWAEILPILRGEIEEAFEVPPGSFYFAGKSLYKRALLCMMADTHGETSLRDTCVQKLKDAYAPFVSNSWGIELAYDTTWGGIVSRAGLSGDPIADFGNSYYNDHHYHWGYFVTTAAILRHLDPAWAQAHTDFVETLIRDVANPSADDTHFPTTRSFDWFAGHSWSQGVFMSADGKDQESTSEEVNFHYGAMLWGLESGNSTLYNLSRLMLATSVRSINTYFLMRDGSTIHPPSFVGNHVTGIFFENKCDYATWFGSNPEFIHGIQMLPVTPITEEVRFADFVEQEWELLSSVAPSLESGWKSVLYTNYATIEPDAAYETLKTAPLDDGLTRSWALYWAATRPRTPTAVPPARPESDEGYVDWQVGNCTP